MNDQAPAARAARPRPKRGEGQWALGYREPLNANEQFKKDDDALNVRARIENIYSVRGFGSIDPNDLRGRMRWWGLYTQRAEGFDGGKTATVDPAALDADCFMLRVRSDGKVLGAEQLRALGEVSKTYARNTADITDRSNIQYHWIRIEDVPAIWKRLEGVGLDSQEACGDSPRPFLGSPVAGIAKDEIIDGSSALDEIKRRFIGNPDFSNLPRKFKTALTGHPSHDVAPEVNDVSFVGTVHPEHGPGFDLWVGGGLSTNPMLAQKLGVWIPHRGGRRRVGGGRLHLPRLRLPPPALARPAEVPGRRLGHREVPRGPRDRVPPPHARRLRLPRRPRAPGRPHRRPRAEGRQVLRRRRAHRWAAWTVRRCWAWPTWSSGTARPAPGSRRTRSWSSSGWTPATSRRSSPTWRRSGSPRGPRTGGAARWPARASSSASWRSSTPRTGPAALVTELERRFPALDTPITVNVNGCPNACARTQVADIGLKGQLVLDAAGKQVEGFQVHLGGALGLGAGFGRKLRAHKVTSAGLDDYVTNVVEAYLADREAGESFATWVGRADEELLRGESLVDRRSLAGVPR